MKLKTFVSVTAATLMALNLAACSSNNDDEDDDNLSRPLPGNAQAFLLIKTGTGAFQIQRVSNSNGASVAATAQTISGLPAGEDLVGMDIRPSNGALYLVGRNGGAANSLGAIYRVDTLPASGSITPVLVGELTANGTDASSPFAGFNDEASFGVDFNPAADALRIVGSNGENLRIPFAGENTGTAVITDSNLNVGGTVSTGIAAAAYTNSDTDVATATELFVMRPASGELFLQAPPNDGVLALRATVRDEGDALTSASGLAFDILTAGATNTAFLAGQEANSPEDAGIGTLDLTTGAFTPLFTSGDFASTSRIRGLAVRVTPQ